MSAAEKQELIQRDEPRQVAQQPAEVTAIMAVIERVATNPEADIAKLEKMLDMQERILDRNAKQAFTADLAQMQIELPRVVEHGKGHNNAKYALLEDINDAIRPTLHKYGFAVTFRVKQEGSGINVTTVLSHREGHSEETSIFLAPDTSGSKNAVQSVGSTISYGKRYGLCAMLNISTGDDTDGETVGIAGDWVSAIQNCHDLPSLQLVFKQAYEAVKKNKAATKQIVEAKDKRKKELSRGAA